MAWAKPMSCQTAKTRKEGIIVYRRHLGPGCGSEKMREKVLAEQHQS